MGETSFTVVPRERAVVKIPPISAWEDDNPMMRTRDLGVGAYGEATLWVRSESSYNETIPGLGKWVPVTPGLREAALCSGEFAPDSTWIQQHLPSAGTVIVRKVPLEPRQPTQKVSRVLHTVEELMKERAALLRLQETFEPNDRVRPVRLVGYGMASNINTRHPEAELPYLLLEYIPPRFVSLKEYLIQQGGHLPLQKAITITSDLADLLVIVHKAGVSEGDINFGGGLRHILYDPKTQEMRLIDFNQAGLRIPGYETGFAQDRAGIVNTLFALLTGNENVIEAFAAYRKETQQHLSYSKKEDMQQYLEVAFAHLSVSKEIKNKLLTIFFRSFGFEEDSYEGTQARPSTQGVAERTANIAQDLHELLLLIT